MGFVLSNKQQQTKRKKTLSVVYVDQQKPFLGYDDRTLFSCLVFCLVLFLTWWQSKTKPKSKPEKKNGKIKKHIANNNNYYLIKSRQCVHALMGKCIAGTQNRHPSPTLSQPASQPARINVYTLYTTAMQFVCASHIV